MALKDQTDDLLSKENVKDAAMFGAEFIPGVGEALAIKRTSDALDQKDYMGAGIEATAGLLGIIPGVGDLAGKGLRVATKGLRKADIDEANMLIKDDAAAEAWKKENKLLESQRQQRVPEVQKAAEELKEGKITSKEYRRAVTANQPIKAITKENFPDMPTKTEIVGALKATDPRKVDTGIVGLNKNIPDGTRVGSRLDIPSYDGYDKWIVSLHDGTKKGGNAIGYGQTAVLKDVEFVSSAKGGLNIATGKNKATIARIHGDYINAEPENVFEAAKKLIDDPEWTQVGMNPFRHSYFYNKATGTPVTRADEVIQVGPLVLAKGVKKPTISELKELKIKTKNNKIRVFNEGGAVMQKQMEMFEDGGLMDEGGTIDPVSGNDVPPGSTQEEVRDDIPAQLSEGEFVFPADVVRYIGLGNLMRMRQEAKMGLKLMDEMGQMGNSEEASIPDDMPFDINDLDMEDEPEYNVGGFVPAQQQQQFGIAGYTPAAQPTTGYYQAPFTQYGQPQQPVQAASQQFVQPTTPVAQAPVPTMQDYQVPEFSEFVGGGFGEYDELREYRNEAGNVMMIPFKDGNPISPIPEGYTFYDPEETATEEVTTTPTTTETTKVREEDPTEPVDPIKQQRMKDRIATAKELGFTTMEGVFEGIGGTFAKYGADSIGKMTGTGYIIAPDGKLLDPLTGEILNSGGGVIGGIINSLTGEEEKIEPFGEEYQSLLEETRTTRGETVRKDIAEQNEEVFKQAEEKRKKEEARKAALSSAEKAKEAREAAERKKAAQEEIRRAAEDRAAAERARIARAQQEDVGSEARERAFGRRDDSSDTGFERGSIIDEAVREAERMVDSGYFDENKGGLMSNEQLMKDAAKKVTKKKQMKRGGLASKK